MAMSTFSFFLPLPFFAAAGGFGGAAAFGAFGAFLTAFGAPAAPTRAKVLLRSSIAASEARALILIAWWLSLLVGQATALSLALRAVTASAACWECYCLSRAATTAGMPSFARFQVADCAFLEAYSTLASQSCLRPSSRRHRVTGSVRPAAHGF